MNIDIAMADKVMGWGKWSCRTVFIGGISWHPSTDIGQAFEAAEKGFYKYWLIKEESGRYRCVGMKHGSCVQKRATADTIEMAICMALLSD